MPYYTSPIDSCQLHYLDYRPSTDPSITLIFLHGWPMSSAMYSHLYLPLLKPSHPTTSPVNIRILALDRRGFGKSDYTGPSPSSPSNLEITYDTFATDTLSLLTSPSISPFLTTTPFLFIAASMACGESLLVHARLPPPLQAQCAGFIWLGPSLPFPLSTPSNPTAPPRELWDAILAGLRADRAAFARAAMPGVFGVGPDGGGIEEGGKGVSKETLEAFARLVDCADAVAVERCVEVITGRDFSGELRELAGKMRDGGGRGEKVMLLVLHGDRDQGMPFEASSKIVKELVPEAEVKVYEKAAHGLYLTHQKEVLDDIWLFIGKISKPAGNSTSVN